ncbi:PucR family transcriptional regulator [Candidatus Spongiisocius sp.]|uniref:PucR family transcriptional regulator n=1 Tax=Candidatus Spongiisocius sp. TaxID=3101273 RepID=UPI003B5AD7D9
MLTVGQLLVRDHLGSLMRFAGGHPDAGPVHSVALIERLAEIKQAHPGSMCVCTGEASLEADTYRLDLAIRNAAARGVKALVFKRGSRPIAPTARLLAERSRVALLAASEDCDLGGLVNRLNAALRDDVVDILAGAQTLLEALDSVTPGDTPPDFDAWAQHATRVLGRTVRRDDPDCRILAEARIGEHPVVRFGADRGNPGSDTVVKLALRAMAGAAVRVMSPAYSTPLRDRAMASLLAELILADRTSDLLIARAEQLGFQPAGNHFVIRIALEDHGSEVDRAARLAATREAGDRLARHTLSGHRGEGAWHPVGLAETLTYVWTGNPIDPLPAPFIRTSAAALVASIDRELRPAALWCGVGGVHEGIHGLRASAAEARAALTHAQTSGIVSRPILYDAMGLRRMLLEWATADAPRRAFDGLLRPMASMTPSKRRKMIDTIVALFEHEGNLAEAARHLGVHRNTIDTRRREIYDLLDLDPADSDHRLMLYLAARTRSHWPVGAGR